MLLLLSPDNADAIFIAPSPLMLRFSPVAMPCLILILLRFFHIFAFSDDVAAAAFDFFSRTLPPLMLILCRHAALLFLLYTRRHAAMLHVFRRCFRCAHAFSRADALLFRYVIFHAFSIFRCHRRRRC